MSAYIGQYGDNGAGLILNAGIRTIENAQSQVAFQASSGVTSETFSGMDTSSRDAVFSITPKLSQIASDKNNVHAAKARLTVTQGALKNIIGLAQNMAASILDISRSSAEPTNLTDAAVQAQSGIANVGNYLNTSTGNAYVFSGSHYKQPPVPHPNQVANSKVAQKIEADMQQAIKRGESPGVAFQKATKDMVAEGVQSNDDKSQKGKSAGHGRIFASFLYADKANADKAKSDYARANLQLANDSRDMMALGNGDDNVTYGLVATQGNPSSVNITNDIDSNGGPKASTGSPVKDLLRDFMMIQGMRNASPSGNQYMSMMHAMHESLDHVANSLIDMESAVGYKQDALDQRQGTLNMTETTLNVQLSKARNVDPAQLAVKSQNLQLGLKASFILIAQMRNMSLANYI